jgi:ribonuclease Z
MSSLASLTPAPAHAAATGNMFNGCELTFLGSASQGCAHGFSSALALRLHAYNGSQAWLFDAGESTVQQIQRSHLRVSQIRHIFITHMHADHVYGLPGVVLAALSTSTRRGSSSADGLDDCRPVVPLTVYGPTGIRAFLRANLGITMPNFNDRGLLRIVELEIPADLPTRHRFRRAHPYWNAVSRPLPFEDPVKPLRPLPIPGCPNNGTYYNIIGDPLPEDHRSVGAPEGSTETAETLSFEGRQSASQPVSVASVHAAIVAHSVPSIAYVITEHSSGIRFDKQKLLEHGLPTDGRSSHREYFQRLLEGESVVVGGRTVHAGDITRSVPPPRRICIVGDTSDASGVAPLCRNVDVLVHEATTLAADSDIARSRGHSSSRTAAEFAKRVGARRVILNHTSVSYSAQQIRTLEAEARALLGRDRAYVAHDMSVFNVPFQGCDGPAFAFRVALGNPRYDRAQVPDEATGSTCTTAPADPVARSGGENEMDAVPSPSAAKASTSASTLNARCESKKPPSILEKSTRDIPVVGCIPPLRLRQVRW